MDCDQENMLNDGSYQDDDKAEGSDRAEKSSEEIEKMKRSPSEFCEVGDKPKADEGTGPAIRKCEFCGKEFNSGKALGGHKRFHLQAQRKERAAATNNANCDGIKLSSLKTNGKLKLSCYLCNKDFPSEKSLFGHMRSHPDRDWRGVHPPIPSDKHSSCSSNFDSMEQKKDDDYFSAVATAVTAPNEPATDLSKSLSPSWRKTNKRGRECVYGAEVVAAAETLLFISRESWSCAEFPELPQGANLNEDGDCDRLNNGGKALYESGDENMDNEEEETNWTEEEYCVKNMKGTSNDMKKKNKKRKKLILKLKSQYSESEDNLPIKTLKTNLKTQDEYKCGICGKSFSTFQALGGHRSGHSKEKNNNSAMNEGSPPDAGEDQASHSSDPTTLDIDLNEPYVMQDEEDESIDQA